MSRTPGLTRRGALMGLGAAAAAAAVAAPWKARAQTPGDRRYVIVLTGTGGASIIDAMLAIRESESRNAATLNVYPDALVQNAPGSPLRFIDQRLDDIGPLPYAGEANQGDFVRRRADQMAVFTYTGTSVNHLIAEKRALTGNDAWHGRTVQEVCAATYGEGLLLPNVNMGVGGFIEPGIDPTLPAYARAEPVTNAVTWPFGLHGSKGVRRAPSAPLIDKARRAREALEARALFDRTFTRSDVLEEWRSRRVDAERVEAQDLITRLNAQVSSRDLPLAQFGLGSSPDAALIARTFPRATTDALEAQAALAYLLIKNGISVSVTLGPSLSPAVGGEQIVDSPPLAFDFSHTAHRGGQAVMWSRLLSVAGRLIDLLEAAEHAGGGSYWDRTLMYFATDFGRTRSRPANARDFGSGHHLNNGALLVSPLLRGNAVYGGVDPDTALTYGFDPATGRPEPGRQMTERELFAGIVQTLGVSTAGTGLPDLRAIRRA
jgi:hypothetical protein